MSRPNEFDSNFLPKLFELKDIALNIMSHKFFPNPCLFAPKAQKGIDKGKKSTRFCQRCIVGWKYTLASISWIFVIQRD